MVTNEDALADLADRAELGARLHGLRYRRRWSLRTVSMRTGIPETTLSRWERGRGAGYPPLERLHALAQLYGVRVVDLLDASSPTRV